MKSPWSLPSPFARAAFVFAALAVTIGGGATAAGAATGTALTVTTTSLATSVQLHEFHATLQASGGTRPYHWSATGLGRGMTLSSSGVLSGAPSLPGSIPFVAKVTDATGASATQKLLLLIDYPPTLVMTTTKLPNPTEGQYYSAPIHATGGEPPYVWAVTDKVLPPGLGIDIPTGTVSGTPTKSGTWRFAITDNDNAGEVAIRYFTLVVKPGSAWSSTTIIALVIGIILLVLVVGFLVTALRRRGNTPTSRS
jgi:hypothetical protein